MTSRAPGLRLSSQGRITDSMTGFEFRAQRLDLQLTQPQLGELLGVSVHAIRKWERAEAIPVIAELAMIGLTMLLEAGDDPEPTMNGAVTTHRAA
jgi:DNA-binding XRE family transcriptional regulator